MRGFSDEERERIREELVRSGREQFLRYGPEKTNVADVTEPVGIAKSTFYRFFDSKSELYFEIFLRERDEFLDRLRCELDGVEDAEVGLVRLFDCYFSWAEESPLLQKVISEFDYEFIYRDIPEDVLEEAQQVAIDEIVPFVERWQETGGMRDVDPELFFALMGGVASMTLHRDEFEEYGEGMYESVRDLLIETVARGLTAPDSG